MDYKQTYTVSYESPIERLGIRFHAEQVRVWLLEHEGIVHDG